MISSDKQAVDPATVTAPSLGASDSWWHRVKEGLFALSLANLCLANAWFLILNPPEGGYFNKVPLNSPTLLALAGNLAWFAILTWLCVRFFRRFSNRWFRFAAHVLFFLVLLLPLEFLRIYVFKIPDYRLVGFLVKPFSAAILVLTILLLLWQHRRAAQLAAILVGLLSPLALLTFARILVSLAGLEVSARAEPRPALAALAPVPDGQPRVLWLIFDEMDFRLPFEDPLANLQIPEFERLRREVFFATNALPPGDCTLVSIPSLTAGKRLAAVSFTNAPDLAVTVADDGQTGLWSQMPSVFSEAHDAGVNSAVVGWYHPYDRIFGQYITYCEWYPLQLGQYLKARTFGTAMSRQIGCLACTPYSRYIYGEISRSSIADSLSVVTNPSYGLLFFHLPPPHKPGVYRPATDTYSVIPVAKPKAYANNLVLADRTLGRIRRALEGAKLWDRTWVIISSDHSWRESAAVDGKRDLRVPFWLKSAGTNQPVTYPNQFNTVLTQGLIVGILRGAITNQLAAVGWIERNRTTEGPSRGQDGGE